MSTTSVIQFPLGSTSDKALATLAQSDPDVWELEMHSAAENRLHSHFIWNCLMPALDHVEKEWRQKGGFPGALVLTGQKSQKKFFCNGLDFDEFSTVPSFARDSFNPILRRLLTFPLPVVAAINGHAFAGGFILALVCDYRIITSGKAWCSMNERLLGAPLPTSVNAIINYRLPESAIIRKTILETHRWTAKELATPEIGLIDQVADDLLAAAHAQAKKVAPLAKTGVFGILKAGLAKDVLDAMKLDERVIWPTDDHASALSRLARL
ncbi:ClpP/crotonase [Clavulina sp. PMI_390]|nr:ClpP/crotonase [Clavulina sp. PMI_390]